MTEIWKPVVGYENLYEVSSGGSVRGVERKDKAGRNTIPSAILKGVVSKKGYVRVNLTDSLGRHQKHSVHTLVLNAFKGPKPTAKHECRHLNNIPSCNEESNLEWGLPTENWQDKRKAGSATVGEKHPSAKLKECDVLAIRASKNMKRAELAEKYGVSISSIDAIRSGRLWKEVKTK